MQQWRRCKLSDRNDDARPITQAVTATGTLNPVVTVQVGSQVSGNIAKLFVDFNSQVKAGQVVAQIDPALFQATVTQAEGDLANAQAGLSSQKRMPNGHRNCLRRTIPSQADLDQAMATLHQAEANVKIKQGAWIKPRADLDHCTINSPIDGVVISRSVDVGQTVAASLQAPVIFAIANDLTKMQIDSNVAEADVGVVKIDQNVDFTVDAFPMQTFHGKVVQVRNAPITVQNVVTYDTVIGVSNADLKLKPGMTANVSIVIAHKDDVLKSRTRRCAIVRRMRPRLRRGRTGEPHGTVPAEEAAAVVWPRATRTHGLRFAGWRRSAAAERRSRPGSVMAILTEVVEGLKEGDRVVTAELAQRRPRHRLDESLRRGRRFP